MSIILNQKKNLRDMFAKKMDKYKVMVFIHGNNSITYYLKMIMILCYIIFA